MDRDLETEPEISPVATFPESDHQSRLSHSETQGNLELHKEPLHLVLRKGSGHHQETAPFDSELNGHISSDKVTLGYNLKQRTELLQETVEEGKVELKSTSGSQRNGSSITDPDPFKVQLKHRETGAKAGLLVNGVDFHRNIVSSLTFSSIDIDIHIII